MIAEIKKASTLEGLLSMSWLLLVIFDTVPKQAVSMSLGRFKASSRVR